MATRRSSSARAPEKVSVGLLVATDEARRQLTERIARGRELLDAEVLTEPGLRTLIADHRKWADYCKTLLERLFEGPILREWVDPAPSIVFDTPPLHRRADWQRAEIREQIERLESIVERLDLWQNPGAADQRQQGPTLALDLVERLCERFHLVARQLRSRHNDRETLGVTDEYDVQDLMHALLRVHFDDVREEEYSPSYAGASTRMDFLLAREQIVLEVKHSRAGLSSKVLGTQLIEDIARYSTHPACGTLVCFVYDPLGLIANPRGLEDDLQKVPANFPVVVRIRPI